MLTLIEIVIVVVLIVITVTQIVMPLFGFGRYFWAFRPAEKRICQIEEELEEIQAQESVLREEQRLKNKTEQLKKKKGENNGPNEQQQGGRSDAIQ